MYDILTSVLSAFSRDITIITLEYLIIGEKSNKNISTSVDICKVKTLVHRLMLQ
jgi:hypothetical protein